MIAAKPEKPCDRGVFGAFYLLLKKEQNTRIRAASGLRFVPAALALCGFKAWALPASPASRAACRAKARSISPGAPFITAASQSAAVASRKPTHFATTSIAAKPVKPCDRGVFGAFYLLLKKEQTALCQGRCLAFQHFGGGCFWRVFIQCCTGRRRRFMPFGA